MNLQDDIEQQIKKLDRDKRIEELRRLRASSKTKWISPTVLALLLPLLGGSGLWIVGELKQYSEAYEALAEQDAFEREKDALQAQKDSLNIEIGTLLQLKAHYADEARTYRLELEAQQEIMNKTYLRGVFTRAEALYALGHVTVAPLPDDSVLTPIKEDLRQLPEGSAATMARILNDYVFARGMVQVTRDVVAEFDNALQLIPAEDWTHELVWNPSGRFIAGRNIMQTGSGPDMRLYDVGLGRFLTREEAEEAIR